MTQRMQRLNPHAMGAVPQLRAVGSMMPQQQAMVGLNEFDFPYGPPTEYPLQGPFFRPTDMVPGVPGPIPGGPIGMPPGCAPCAPGAYGDPRIWQAWWQERCLEREARARRAVLANQLASAPKHGMGLNSPLDEDGFPVPIPPGTSVTLTTEPNVWVCPVDWKVTTTVAPFFWLESLRIGQVEAVVKGDPIPLDTMSSIATCCPLLQFKTLSPGTKVELTVHNVDADPRYFESVFWVIVGRDRDRFVPDHSLGGCIG